MLVFLGIATMIKNIGSHVKVKEEFNNHILALSRLTKLYNDALGYPWGGILLWLIILVAIRLCFVKIS